MSQNECLRKLKQLDGIEITSKELAQITDAKEGSNDQYLRRLREKGLAICRYYPNRVGKSDFKAYRVSEEGKNYKLPKRITFTV